ncbi:hypothetical protein QCA50_012544 [Cerrena zonata]|uniref:Uncharacterized protein n=1 Tax=Cerrena zonata TaxID=2478898 RepID=A0AAW0G5B6_9APHY
MPQFRKRAHAYLLPPTQREFLGEWPEFLLFAQDHPVLSVETTKLCAHTHTEMLPARIASLANKETGWHFSAKNGKAEQIEAFSVSEMAHMLKVKAPPFHAASE